MNKEQIISLIERCVTTTQAKVEASQVHYQHMYDPVQKQSALVNVRANIAVRSTLQALLEAITEDEDDNIDFQ